MASMKHSQLMKKANRVSGFSTPFGGVSWEPKQDEAEEIRKLLAFIEDRRVFHITDERNIEITTGSHKMQPKYVVDSIQKIREEITGSLRSMSFSAVTRGCLERMRAACRQYLDTNYVIVPTLVRLIEKRAKTIGEFRAAMGIEIARLCALHQLDVEEDLVPLVNYGLNQLKQS
jgi:hypothetical protein